MGFIINITFFLSNSAALIDGIEGCPQVNPLCFIGDFKAEWDDCILGLILYK